MNRLYIGLCTVLLLTACSKSDAPESQPAAGFVESILSKKYWKEEIHFLYQRRGSDDPTIYMDRQDIVAAFRVEGGAPFADQVLLDAVYIDKDDRLYRYVREQDEYTGYFRNNYAIEYDERNQAVRILTPHDSLKYMGAVAGSRMEIVSLTDEKVVFDAPIKPFIRLNWQLDNPDIYPHSYLGIRIVWTRLDPNLFTWANMLD